MLAVLVFWYFGAIKCNFFSRYLVVINVEVIFRKIQKNLDFLEVLFFYYILFLENVFIVSYIRLENRRLIEGANTALLNFILKVFRFIFDNFAIVGTIFLDPFYREVFIENFPGSFGYPMAFEEFLVDWIFTKIGLHTEDDASDNFLVIIHNTFEFDELFCSQAFADFFTDAHFESFFGACEKAVALFAF